MGFANLEEVQEIKKPELSNGRANKLDPQDRAFHDCICYGPVLN
jgi:hypothetical protein